MHDPFAARYHRVLDHTDHDSAHACMKFLHRVPEEVDDAASFAEQGSLEPVEELTRFLYAEQTA